VGGICRGQVSYAIKVVIESIEYKILRIFGGFGAKSRTWTSRKKNRDS
jgi:hypothetical protein